MKFEIYLKWYLMINADDEGKGMFDKKRFWAMTCLMTGMGSVIQTKNGHYLTPYDCVNELEDIINETPYEGGWVQVWWEQFQYLRGQIKKQKWMY